MPRTCVHGQPGDVHDTAVTIADEFAAAFAANPEKQHITRRVYGDSELCTRLCAEVAAVLCSRVNSIYRVIDPVEAGWHCLSMTAERLPGV